MTRLDYTGYDFWLTKLNQFNGNYIDGNGQSFFEFDRVSTAIWTVSKWVVAFTSCNIASLVILIRDEAKLFPVPPLTKSPGKLRIRPDRSNWPAIRQEACDRPFPSTGNIARDLDRPSLKHIPNRQELVDHCSEIGDTPAPDLDF